MSDRRSWQEQLRDDLDRLRGQNRYRERKRIRPIDATHVEWGGKQFINFSSNDYLGLSHHPRVIDAARAACEQSGFGSGAAPLVTGFGPAHESAEHAVAAWKGCESAVLLPSGFQANIAAIQTAAAISAMHGGVRFLVDKLSHASLIDAVRSSGEPFRVYPHNHIIKLQRLLEERPPDQLQVVVTESIFSMDGDAADLRAISGLKERHGFLWILDEAHATGVYGPAGAGLAAELNLREAVDVSVITLSKALGGIGGAVCGSALFCAALANFGRAYLFSTSILAAAAAAAQAAVEVLKEEPDRQQRVRALAKRVRAELAEWKAPPGDSPIIPLIMQDEAAALAASNRLAEKGLLVVAIRPPTVPRGSSRLRVTLSCEHTDAEVGALIDAIRRL